MRLQRKQAHRKRHESCERDKGWIASETNRLLCIGTCMEWRLAESVVRTVEGAARSSKEVALHVMTFPPRSPTNTP